MCEQKNLPEFTRGGIGDVGGVPRDRAAQNETEKWGWFKSLIKQKAKRGVALGEVYASAKVSKKQSEVRKNLEEAAKLAAERKHIEAEEQLKRQKAVQEFNKAVDEIYADDGLPDSAKMLKLAKLMENNPEIEKQVDVINTIIKRLSYTKGLVFEVRQEQKSLAEGGELLEEDVGE